MRKTSEKSPSSFGFSFFAGHRGPYKTHLPGGDIIINARQRGEGYSGYGMKKYFHKSRHFDIERFHFIIAVFFDSFSAFPPPILIPPFDAREHFSPCVFKAMKWTCVYIDTALLKFH
jgi:hypothetical protein